MNSPAARNPRNTLFILGVVVMALGLVSFLSCSKGSKPGDAEEFLRLSRDGKKYYDSGDLPKAVVALEKALAQEPRNRDAHLNLANAYLLNNQANRALDHGLEALQIDTNSAAGYYLAGSAQLRLGQAEAAVKTLQQAKDADRTINAVSYQLGRAYQMLGNYEAAAKEFEEVVEFEPDHQAAHYNLSQVYQRLNKPNEAAAQVLEHNRSNAGKPSQISDPSKFERTRYTRIVVPFRVEQPAPEGIKVAFADATAAAFGAAATHFRGPIAVVDFQRRGHNGIFVQAGAEEFQLLANTNGIFTLAASVPANATGFNEALVGDLNNDHVDDVVMIGTEATQAFKLSTNGTVTDITAFARLKEVRGLGGLLVDADYTGKLDLLVRGTGTNGLTFLRNLGQPYFVENATNLVLPSDLKSVHGLFLEDWNQDDLLDIIVARAGAPPLLLSRVRGGKLIATNALADFPAGEVVAIGDLDNDYKPDLATIAGRQLIIRFQGRAKAETILLPEKKFTHLDLVDYDNDGWLDVLVSGEGVFAWRNRGTAGFVATTHQLGLDQVAGAPVASLVVADFDNDCDTDLMLTLAQGGLRLLRNDGGNANHQLRIRLAGTKSNASGLGIRLEIFTEGLQMSRRVTRLPVEIGVGRNPQIDSLVAHWFDFDLATVDLRADRCEVLTLQELQINSGSCPYLYAWNGQTFRFVTDLLGAAPLGLPLSEGRLIDTDPHEYVWIGAEAAFPARQGNFVLQVTEELREVLYLDEAKLVVVDHPPETEVYTTGKLLPGKPYPASSLVTLHLPKPLRRAVNHRGTEITELLQAADDRLVSPTELREPQLMGLAKPHSVTLDFGPLASDKPLVLAFTAWLRFGGATANIAASHQTELPFPFPSLEVELSDGTWKTVEVMVGAPAGKTKNYIVDLTGRLPEGAQQLRLTTAFELHWDRVSLWEKRDNADTQIHVLNPVSTDLHWRGFSDYRDLPASLPLTPNYDVVHAWPIWRWTPGGWVTRYGPVDELVASKDNALALVAGGDELTLTFSARQIPQRSSGQQRDFFFYSVGWDKDADVHCVEGSQVEPLPWHGMDDQLYGRQARPRFPNDDWISRYNTRWVGSRTLSRAAAQRN